jgi:hypothetical protein
MVQKETSSAKGYISIPAFTKDKTERARLYRLVRERRLIQGKDYKIIVRETPVILVKKNLKIT